MNPSTAKPIDPPVNMTITIDSMNAVITNLNLGKSATVNGIFFYKGNHVRTQTFILQGDDYNNWGNDDDYIYSWILSQIK
jgi:hypothetical protein